MISVNKIVRALALLVAILLVNSVWAGSLPNDMTTIKESGTLIFMQRNYEFQDVNPIYGDNDQIVAMSSEYLPGGQNFDSWKNLITVQAFIGNKTMDTSEFAWALYDVIKNKTASLVESPVINEASGVIYLVEYQGAKLSSGDGSVTVIGKQTTATGNLKKTASNRVMERSIHKIYIDKKSGNLVNLIYGERKYGKVNKAQFLQWDNQSSAVIDQMDKLSPRIISVKALQ
jgi:hypothetical protein